MGRVLLAAVAACGLLTSAQAQTSVTSRVGDWESFEGLAYGNDEVCGMGVYDHPIGFLIRFFVDHGEFQIINRARRLPPNYRMPVTLSIGSQSWRWNARSATAEIMLLDVPVSDYAPVLHAMQAGSEMTWNWDNGIHGRASLIGSRAIIAKTWDCIGRRLVPQLAPNS